MAVSSFALPGPCCPHNTQDWGARGPRPCREEPNSLMPAGPLRSPAACPESRTRVATPTSSGAVSADAAQSRAWLPAQYERDSVLCSSLSPVGMTQLGPVGRGPSRRVQHLPAWRGPSGLAHGHRRQAGPSCSSCPTSSGSLRGPRGDAMAALPRWRQLAESPVPARSPAWGPPGTGPWLSHCHRA